MKFKADDNFGRLTMKKILIFSMAALLLTAFSGLNYAGASGEIIVAQEKVEEKAKEEAEKKAKEEAKKKAKEEKARKKAEEKARKEAEKKAKEAVKAEKKAEEKAKKEAEKKAKAEAKAKKEAEEKAKKEAEEKAKEAAKAEKEAEAKAKKEAEEKAKTKEETKEEAEKKAKEAAKAEKKAEEKAQKEAEKKVKEEAKARKKAEKARKKAEEKARKEEERKARGMMPPVKKAVRPEAAAKRGRTGLIRTISVDTLDQGVYRINTHLEYFYAKRRLSYVAPGDFPDYEAAGITPTINEKGQRLEGTAAISYGAYQWKKYPLGLEVSFAGSGYSHSLVGYLPPVLPDEPPVKTESLVQSLGDLELGVKLAYGLGEGIGLGLDSSLQFLTNSGDLGYRAKATSAEFRLLSTFELADIKNFPFENFPLTLHLNLGIHIDKSDKIGKPSNILYDLPETEYALGIIRENQFLLNFAFEYPLDTIGSIGRMLKKNYLDFYLEYSAEDILGSGFGRSFTESNQRITLGPRLFLLSNHRLAVDLMFDIGLSKLVSAQVGDKVCSEPGWRLISGVSYTFIPAAKVAEPTTGTITGRVTDAKTGKPIEGAVISFPGTGLSSIVTNADGRYTTCEIEAGRIELAASRDGYFPQSKKVMVEAGKTVTQDFKLAELVKAGTLNGKVTDAKRRPLAAVISFEKPIASVATDPKSGEYTIKLPPDKYEVTATAEGYKPQSKPAVIEDKKTTRVDFVLEAIARVGELEGKVTNEQGKPLTAQVNVGVKGITPMNTDAKTGMYRGKLPAGAYQVTAEAKGYSPETKPAAIRDKEKTTLNFVLKLAVAPPEKKPLAVLKAKKIEIRGKIHFETGKSTVLIDSYPILDDVAKILVDNPRVKILIEGHTDSVGSDAYNLNLSKARAESVMKYLVDKGIPGARLKAAGFGESTPIADNTTASGRAKNRRVEFTIISR